MAAAAPAAGLASAPVLFPQLWAERPLPREQLTGIGDQTLRPRAALGYWRGRRTHAQQKLG
jgi:hypothetical protein